MGRVRPLKHKTDDMFGTIRKHQTWLWVFIIAFISVSMVWFFSPDVSLSGDDSSGPAGDYGSINGEPIKPGDYYNALNEVRLTEYLQSGKWPGNDEAAVSRLENQAISRVFLLGKVKELDIKASDKAVALMIHEQLRDYPYATLEKEILEPNKLKIADYERLVRNDVAIRQLVSAASVSSRLVTPAEVEVLWRKENQETSAQLAAFWASNYLDKVTVTNNAISGFYSNRMSLYRLPERLTISYVEFPASNYLAEADTKIAGITNLNEILSEYYTRGRTGTNDWKDTNGVVLSEIAAKDKIKSEMRHGEALLAARRAAAEFGNELISLPDPNKASNLEEIAKKKNLTVKVTKPFDRVGGLEEFAHEEAPAPRNDQAPPESFQDYLREKAFALASTPERPVLFSPIPGRQGVYVIALKGKVPSEQQPFDTVKDKVAADYKSFMAQDMARKAGQAFHIAVTNGLAAGKSFTEIAAAEKVKVIDLPPFSATTRSLTNLDARVSLRLLQNLASGIEVGKASPYLPAQPQSEGGFIFYHKAQPPIDESKLKAELPEFVDQVRMYRQNEAFQQWFRKQAEAAKLAGPKRETTIGAPN
jgi:parvulin-like peptidyl-prolyl isomerase